MLTYGSICSGIEAVSVAWKDLPLKPLWFSEIEPFPCAVLAHHFPDVPNFGDMTALPEKIRNLDVSAPDILVGGTPCQAFSVAGLRQSLDDNRGNLTLALIHILEAIDYVRFQQGKPPAVLVWENVPGVLSTKDNAFGHFLAGLAQESQPLQPTGRKWTNAGYVHSTRTAVWRVLDAQYFGLAQRRKRVFLVASARKRSVAQILIEQNRLPRDFTPCQSSLENPTAYAESSFGAFRQSELSGPLKASGGCLSGGSETLILDKLLNSEQNQCTTLTATAYKQPPLVIHGTQDPITSKKAHCLGRNNGMENVLFEIKGVEAVRLSEKFVSPTLKARMGTGRNNIPCISLAGNTIGRKPENGGNGNGFDESGVSYTLTRTDVHGVCVGSTQANAAIENDLSPTLTQAMGSGGGQIPYIAPILRKLTPIECERLQGFPDNWTKVPYRHKPAEKCPDGPRYKAIGNSMAVPVMRWIGERLIKYMSSQSH